jgi:hypothetical protein
MTPTASMRLALSIILLASALGACTARPPAPTDGGTMKFVADTLTAKGVRP